MRAPSGLRVLAMALVAWLLAAPLAAQESPLAPLGKGNALGLGDLTGPTLLYFWADWCAGCSEGLGPVAESAQTRHVRAVAVVAFTDETKPSTADVCLKVPGLGCYWDKSGSVTKLLGVDSIPSAVLWDGGRVTERYSAVSGQEIAEKMGEAVPRARAERALSERPWYHWYYAGDYRRAQALAEAGAAKGDPESQFVLAQLHEEGFFVAAASEAAHAPDAAAAALWVARASASASGLADRGDAAAEFVLAQIRQFYSGAGKHVEESNALLLKAAEHGDGLAQEYLADLYEHALFDEPDELALFGVVRDKRKAAQWYGKAAATYRAGAERGDAAAQERLGHVYDDGLGVPRDSKEAFAWYLRAAESGNGAAQFRLGESTLDQLLDRDAPPRADPDAWLSKAAESGHVRAQFTLAERFRRAGRAAEALRWYAAAAAQGDREAQYELATMYADGRGIPRDPSKAETYYRLAVDRGAVGAAAGLATLYVVGDGVPRDYGRAAALLRGSQAPKAKMLLGLMREQGFGVSKSSDALSLYLDAARHQLCGLEAVARMLDEGEGVAKDPALAARCWLEAAQRGDCVEAQARAGLMYERGEGVPKDPAQAKAWYRKAADHGDLAAMRGLARLGWDAFSGTGPRP